jgi:hypothetical protein
LLIFNLHLPLCCFFHNLFVGFFRFDLKA